MKRILYLLDLLAVVSMIAGCAAIQEETGADELHHGGYLKIFVSIDGNNNRYLRLHCRGDSRIARGQVTITTHAGWMENSIVPPP